MTKQEFINALTDNGWEYDRERGAFTKVNGLVLLGTGSEVACSDRDLRGIGVVADFDLALRWATAPETADMSGCRRVRI